MKDLPENATMETIPCAAHKPPHQKGRRQSAGNCKSVATASIKACGPHGPLAVQEALGQILPAADRSRPSRFHKKHYVMKCEAQRKACQNMPPKPSKTWPGMPPNLPKSSPRVSWEDKIRSKGVGDEPNDALKRPRRSQGAPKRIPKPPKSSQKPAKRRPRGIPNCPRPFPNSARHAPRRVWSTIFVESSVRQALGAILCCFLSCAQHVRFV